MPAPKDPGKNPPLDILDMARALGESFAKESRVFDARTHVVACRAAGNEEAAQAFVQAAGKAWWTPLYAEPTEETGRAILAKRGQFRPFIQYLEVAWQVPSLRAEAVERFVSEVDASDKHMATDGPECLGALALLDAEAAMGLAERFPDARHRSFDYDGDHGRRDIGATTLLAFLYEHDFAKALDMASSNDNSIPLYGSLRPEYGAMLTLEQYLELARTCAVNDPSQLVEQFAAIVSTWPEGGELASSLYASMERPCAAHASLLARMGRLEEAKAKLEEVKGNAQSWGDWERSLEVGAIDLAEAKQRAGYGTFDGTPPETPLQPYSTLRGLLALSLFLDQRNPDDPALVDLATERQTYVDAGPERDRERFPSDLLHALLCAKQAEHGKPRDALLKPTVKDAKTHMKASSPLERANDLEKLVKLAATFDPLWSYKLAKLIPASNRSNRISHCVNAYLKESDSSGAYLSLIGLVSAKNGSYDLHRHSLAILRQALAA